MALKWSNTAIHAKDHGVKLCVHGRAGAGKTSLIATAPRPIIATAESGTLSIARQAIPMAEITTLADLTEFYRWAKDSTGRNDFDTLCLDSVSEMAERMLTVNKVKAKDPRQAYGELADQLGVMIRQFRDLPGWNVYFSAKTELRDTPEGGKMYGASMPGKQNSNGLAYFFDEFLYLGVDSAPNPVVGQPPIPYRYLLTQPDPQYEAKDRSGALDRMEPPNLTHIFTKIQNHVATLPVPLTA